MANYSPFSFPDHHLYESFRVWNFDHIYFPITPVKNASRTKSTLPHCWRSLLPVCHVLTTVRKMMKYSPKKVMRLRTFTWEVLSETMDIKTTRSHGHRVLHWFEKVWPRTDNVIINDCYRIRNIEKFIPEINKVSCSIPRN